MSKKITILVGSLSNNLELGKKLETHLTGLGASVELINLPKLDLPLYDTDREKDGIPEKAATLSKTLIDSQGIVLVAPEYNGSMPPVVNNAIAWVSRTGDDWRGAFNEKMAVVATHSGGGGAKVCEAMRKQLEHLGCNVLARPIITNFSKELNPESADNIFGQLLKHA